MSNWALIIYCGLITYLTRFTMIALIKKETVKCPNCATPIYKISGCDQMWCTSCNIAFNWRTGRKIKGIIHHFTNKKDVLKKSIKIARDLSLKPTNAMTLTKKRLWQIFKADLNEIFKSAIIYHKKSFNSGEPQKVSKKFLKK